MKTQPKIPGVKKLWPRIKKVMLKKMPALLLPACYYNNFTVGRQQYNVLQPGHHYQKF